MQIEGFALFGTNGASATTVTSGWGSAYMAGSLEVGSNLVMHGSVTGVTYLSSQTIGLVQDVQSVTASGGIEPNSSYIRVQGSGGNVNITAVPQIANGYPGQLLTLQGTLNDRLVILEDGNGIQTALDQPFALGLFDTIQFIFDPVTANWVEVNRSNNRSTND
ncbi:MAG: hypothetical protein EOL87_02860 [Spartobacteria bacterium]|nr:hypothetical protein [Spartobacteria bacterium]